MKACNDDKFNFIIKSNPGINTMTVMLKGVESSQNIIERGLMSLLNFMIMLTMSFYNPIK